jgi:hypothetical protein
VTVVGVPARISAVILACRDIGRMAAFYRQFGWPEASTPRVAVFMAVTNQTEPDLP